jgi:hypothetical protein
MLYPQLKENICIARYAFQRATRDTFNKDCNNYLVLLLEYRNELSKLKNLPATIEEPSSEEINRWQAVRDDIDRLTYEINRTMALYQSAKLMNGYEAVEDLNKRKYKGYGNWTLNREGVGINDNFEDNIMTIKEAIETIRMLKCEDRH